MSTPRSPDRLAVLRRALLAAALGGTLAAVPVPSAQAADDAAVHRARIARDRADVEREARAAQQACAQQFAVTACVDRAKAERRRRLQQLDAELAVLDDAQRRQRAAQRLAELEIRAAQASVQPAAPQASAARAPAVAASVAVSPLPARASPPLRRQEAELAAQKADAKAARRAADAAQRASQAQAHRAAVEQRNLERAKTRTPARPLPLPPAAAASR